MKFRLNSHFLLGLILVSGLVCSRFIPSTPISFISTIALSTPYAVLSLFVIRNRYKLISLILSVLFVLSFQGFAFPEYRSVAISTFSVLYFYLAIVIMLERIGAMPFIKSATLVSVSLSLYLLFSRLFSSVPLDVQGGANQLAALNLVLLLPLILYLHLNAPSKRSQHKPALLLSASPIYLYLSTLVLTQASRTSMACLLLFILSLNLDSIAFFFKGIGLKFKTYRLPGLASLFLNVYTTSLIVILGLFLAAVRYSNLIFWFGTKTTDAASSYSDLSGRLGLWATYLYNNVSINDALYLQSLGQSPHNTFLSSFSYYSYTGFLCLLALLIISFLLISRMTLNSSFIYAFKSIIILSSITITLLMGDYTPAEEYQTLLLVSLSSMTFTRSDCSFTLSE